MTIKAAAKQGDTIEATDKHTVVSSTNTATVADFTFKAPLSSGLSPDVFIAGAAAAVVGSKGTNTPPHAAELATKYATQTFKPPPPDDTGKVDAGSVSVFINGKAAARDGDPATTCSETPSGARVVAASSVFFGG